MGRVFNIFFRARETRPFVVLACLVLGGIAELASISTLLPVATSIVGGDDENSSPLNQFVRDTIQSTGLEPSLGIMIAIVVVFIAIRALLLFAALSYAGITAARVSISLRRRLIAAVFDARWRFYADQNSGRFANTIANDAGRAGDAYQLAARVVAYGVQAVAYVIAALLLDWKLALAGLAAGVFIALALSWLIRISRKAGYKQTDRTSDLTSYMVDMLGNIKALKAMARHGAMLAQMTRTLKRLRKSLVTREISRQGLLQGGDVLVAALIGGGVYSGAYGLANAPAGADGQRRHLLPAGILRQQAAEVPAAIGAGRKRLSPRRTPDRAGGSEPGRMDGHPRAAA